MKNYYSFFFLLTSLCYYGQNILNTKLNEIHYGSSGAPYNLTKLNDLIIFAASRNTEEGLEPWCYNSVTQKSILLKDIFSGHNSGIPANSIFVKINNKVYFLAQENFSGYQIWETDGTSVGTVKRKDINSNYEIEDLVVVGNKIFYYQNKELWSYDIGSDNLLLLKTFEYSGNVKLYSHNNLLIFAANDGITGKEVWKSDGTIVGTTLLKDIAPNNGGSISDFKMLTLNNGKFYFIANTGVGYGIYESDGTSVGTILVKPIQGSGELNGVSAGDYFVFEGFDPTGGGLEPWVSDGTATGTKILKDIMPGNTSSIVNSKFIKINNKIYFDSYSNGISPSYGNYVWETDGTEAGTVLFNTPPETVLYDKSSDGQHLILTKPNYWNRYWITKGNTIQTFEITDIGMSSNNRFIDLNSKIYLTGNNLKHGTELFYVDPVSQVSTIASDISRFESSDPHSFERLNNNLIFIAQDREFNKQLYKRDKNTQQITRLTAFTNGSSSVGMYTDLKNTFFKVGNYLYTKNNSQNQSGIVYRTDGTSANSTVIELPDALTSDNALYVNLNDNTLLFSGYSNMMGTELWKIDNTSNAAVLVKDISTDNMGSMYDTDSRVAVLNGYAYFIAKENGKLGIWKSDGTSTNTVKAIQFNYQDGTDGDIKVLGSFNNKLLFTKREENNSSYGQNELWISNGDQASAVLLKSYAVPWGSGSISRETEVLNNKFYYTSSGYPSGLHSTDGTVTGTTEILSGNFSADTKFKKCGNQLFFTNNNGTQLWRTDGTTTGTYSLASNYSSVKDMICVNDYLYFLNGDSQKVWRTNGTVINTMAMDIFVTNDDNQLLANENIQKLTTDGEKLYFSIFTKEHGTEFYGGTDLLPTYLSVRDTEGINNNGIGNIVIYPNPVNDSFSIKLQKGHKVENIKIFDTTGKLIKSINYMNEKVNVVDLSTGIYFLKIRTDKGDFFNKILKK